MDLEIYFKFILSFALILIAARLGGELVERYLKQPAILGELIAGIAIGPFALGSLVHDPVILNLATIHGVDLFGIPGLHEFCTMEVLSEIAVIALLFVAGVETDVKMFMEQQLTGSLVAVGGVILPFVFGYFATMYLFPEVGRVGWLFIGATLTATSICLTVRILMDMGQMDSREGITILVGAVVDDIIGIVILSVVISIATAAGAGIEMTTTELVTHSIYIAAIGFGIWLALLLFGIYGHEIISKVFLEPFKKSGTAPIFAIIIGYLIAFLGMQVDLFSMQALAGFAILLTILAIIGEIVGYFIPARIFGKLDNLGSTIVGVGMVPRGEVGLIVAGAGLLAGAVTRDLFGAAVAVSVLTTLVTPAMLKPLFKKKVER